MLTSRRLLQQFWHDDRHDIRKVQVWYTDPGAPDDMSMAAGPDISPEPGYLKIRTPSGGISILYRHIMVISYYGAVVFENRKVRDRGNLITGNARDICRCGDEKGGD
jgi:hypothetical protein